MTVPASAATSSSPDHRSRPNPMRTLSMPIHTSNMDACFPTDISGKGVKTTRRPTTSRCLTSPSQPLTQQKSAPRPAKITKQKSQSKAPIVAQPSAVYRRLPSSTRARRVTRANVDFAQVQNRALALARAARALQAQNQRKAMSSEEQEEAWQRTLPPTPESEPEPQPEPGPEPDSDLGTGEEPLDREARLERGRKAFEEANARLQAKAIADALRKRKNSCPHARRCI